MKSGDNLLRHETQSSIAAWGEETFGPAASPLKLVDRAREEMNELAQALEAGAREDAVMEMADVMILLYRLAEDLECNLTDAVARKMAINRAREWRPAGDGTGRHIETD